MITYVEHDGTEHLADVEPGMSLMEGAVWNGIRGIYASCLGDGGCATCQVYLDETWGPRVGEKTTAEKATLRFAWKPAEGSRLSCFIKVTDDLEGLRVHMPERQF